MKILFFIHGMDAGGAERQASLICNHWARSGREVVLATLYDAPSHYDLEENISRRAIRAGHPAAGAKKHWDDMRKMRRLVRDERSDVVIAFIDAMNIKVLLATLGAGVPTIVSERVDPASLSSVYPGLLGISLAMSRWMTYPFSAALVVQTEAAALWGRNRWFSPRVEIIPNAVAPQNETRGCELPQSESIVLSIGRLSYQKGHDILIRAFACIADQFPGWRLKIIGDGDSRRELSLLIHSLGLTRRAELVPVQRSVAQDYRRAGVFVLPSRFEGFPNALIEAMQMGCAVLAADCPVGPREIISDGSDGLLFQKEDVSDLVSKLTALMENAALRTKLGERARETVKKYEPGIVLPLWDRLLDKVLTRR